MTTSHILTASMFRRLAHAVSPLLLCALPLACVAGQEGELELEEEVVGEATQALSSWYWWGHGTTTDLSGELLTVGSNKCFLSGVTGDLSYGDAAAPGVLSTAAVIINGFGLYVLHGHGGASVSSSNTRVWNNNPVFASTTCFPGSNHKTGSWVSNQGSIAPPVKIAELDPLHRRQCFLTGVFGSWLTWDESSNFARVTEVTEPDSAHPTAGWYVESNLSHLSNIGGSPGVQVGRVQVDAACVTVPSELEIITGSTSSNSGFTTHVEIGWQLGARACALTRISGRFGTLRGGIHPGWDDGAVIEPPTEAEGFAGPWRMKVNDGRSAGWACVGDPE